MMYRLAYISFLFSPDRKIYATFIATPEVIPPLVILTEITVRLNLEFELNKKVYMKS